MDKHWGTTVAERPHLLREIESFVIECCILDCQFEASDLRGRVVMCRSLGMTEQDIQNLLVLRYGIRPTPNGYYESDFNHAYQIICGTLNLDDLARQIGFDDARSLLMIIVFRCGLYRLETHQMESVVEYFGYSDYDAMIAGMESLKTPWDWLHELWEGTIGVSVAETAPGGKTARETSRVLSQMLL